MRPIEMPRVPPTGASSCRMEQVLNRIGQYEWHSICRQAASVPRSPRSRPTSRALLGDGVS
jgi:hypothetical protein